MTRARVGPAEPGLKARGQLQRPCKHGAHGGLPGGCSAAWLLDGRNICRAPSYMSTCILRPVENHKVNAELIFAAIHAKRFDPESDIQVQVRAWIFHFDCFFDSD